MDIERRMGQRRDSWWISRLSLLFRSVMMVHVVADIR